MNGKIKSKLKMQEEVKHYKVKTLPTQLRPNSIYYVKAASQSAVKTYITDQGGIPFPLIDLTSLNISGIVNSVTGTGVTGTSNNPVVNISTFKSSQLGNLIELSTNDEKLFVKPITSPDGSIDITSTATSLELQLGASLQTQIQNALQPGNNISELTNDAGYLTTFTETDPIFQASEASLFVTGDKDNLDNQSGINTGDETTESIQIKRPLKTVNGESLEGNGNIQIDYNDLDNLPIIPTILTKHSELDLDDGTNPHGTTKNDVGLGNVPNLDTTDAVNKAHEHVNISILNGTEESFTTALKNAYNSAVSWIITNGTNLINHLTNTSNPHNVTKSQVGLGDVDNTSDLNKPISIATQDALDLKLDKSTIPSKIYGTDISGNQIMISIDDFAGANDFPYTEITKAELDTLIANSGLTKGFYKISGVNPDLYGGTTIFLTAIESNKLSIEGYGIFYNPKYDKSINGFGILKESEVYNIGDRVIWGGKYWDCISPTSVDTEYIFDKFSLSPEYFEEIPFNETDYNVVHDKIKYDYENDLIVERDEYNSNVVSFSYNFLTELSNSAGLNLSEVNPIKNFQWGNLFDDNLQKGIGNNKIKDYLHVNINFSGSYQINLLYDGFIYYNDKYLGLGESGGLSTVSIKSEGSLSTDNVLKINNNSKTLLELNGAGGLGIGVDNNSRYKLLIKAQEEIGGLNSELLSSSGWTSAGWTGDFTTGFTHTTGNTSVLSNTYSGGSGGIYVINIKISNRTAGSIDFKFGSIIRTSLTSSTIIADKAITSSKLNITPTSDFNGTVIVSIRTPSPYNATIGIVNSSGYVVEEIRASNNNYNSFFGFEAGRYNTGGGNSFFGSTSGSSNIIGYSNSFFGAMSGLSNLEGNRNSYFGVESGKLNLGSENSFFGYRSGYGISGGYALSNATNSVFIGYDTKANANNETNQIVIGHSAIGNGSNSVVLGNSSITRTRLQGQVIMGSFTSAPTGIEGAIYYNSTDKKHYGFNGTSWNALY